MAIRPAFLLSALLLAACAQSGDQASGPPVAGPEAKASVDWALAIHGGAGVISKTLEAERREEYLATLREALGLGRDRLAAGDPSLDVVEAVIQVLEDSPLFNAGKGAVFTHEGTNELDAAIMDGRNLACGSVAGLETVKSPIHLARLVMERSPHVFMAGAGAEQFATEMGVERVEPDYFFTERRWQQLQDALAGKDDDGKNGTDEHGTVGAVALDRDGNLAAATSTGGLTDKRFGRIGDVPVIGAGTYASNRTAAISCTGQGEEFIRHDVAHDISALIEYRGMSVGDAARTVIGKLRPGDGGVIAVGHDGSIALVFNSEGMFRGAADAGGRFEVAIWE